MEYLVPILVLAVAALAVQLVANRVRRASADDARRQRGRDTDRDDRDGSDGDAGDGGGAGGE